MPLFDIQFVQQLNPLRQALILDFHFLQSPIAAVYQVIQWHFKSLGNFYHRVQRRHIAIGLDSGDNGKDIAHWVEQTKDGGYILVGETTSYGAGQEDIWLIKTDGNGNKLWDKTFGGKDIDIAYNVRQTPEGGYILVGETLSFGPGNVNAWIIKTDENGNCPAAEKLK